MKRAVNALLKNIDRISLIRNGVLLVGATNHPQLLDEAAWRRFDEVVEFSLPGPGDAPGDPQKRDFVHDLHLRLSGDCSHDRGILGADISVMIKEALLSALMDKREAIDRQDR